MHDNIVSEQEKNADQKRQQLQILLEERVAAKAESADFRSDSSAVSSVCVPIRTRGTQPLLVCIVGGGAGQVTYRRLAEYLPESQPVTVLQFQGLRAEDSVNRSIDKMAESHLIGLQAEFPNGPYALCGHSMGGVVALEMAQRLLSRGQQVTILCVLDQPGPNVEINWRHWLYWQWSAVSQLPRHQRLAYFSDGLKFRLQASRLLPWFLKRWLFGNLTKTNQSSNRSTPSVNQYRLQMLDSSLEALKSYRPQEIDVPFVLFRAKSGAPKIHADECGGWGKIARGPFRTINIPGHHMTMLAEENLPLLGAELTRVLLEPAVNTTVL